MMMVACNAVFHVILRNSYHENVLQVARHVVESGTAASAMAAAANGDSPASSDPAHHIRTAVDFLRETDGLLRIEDILPCFPDFVTIDNFQASACTPGGSLCTLPICMEASSRRCVDCGLCGCVDCGRAFTLS